MSYETSFFQLPCGARGFRLEASGTFSGEDAAAMYKLIDSGGELHGLPCLILTRNLSSITSEARRFYVARGYQGDREPWMAAVVTNPIILVTARFLIRITRNERIGLFSREPEAIQWLDERTREDAARAKAT